jgi:hypothetical protein
MFYPFRNKVLKAASVQVQVMCQAQPMLEMLILHFE